MDWLREHLTLVAVAILGVVGEIAVFLWRLL
jgi:hypothetical protein